MAELKIIRASAGSGKTYTLTEEILSILMREPLDYYKRILAVTFTNKATAEMKGRILKELHFLGSGQASSHLEMLVAGTGRSQEQIRNKSRSILSAILHGYSWFRIETIDTFFQGIIRSFLRELNIAGYYTIELDQDAILSEAIDHLLDNISSKKDMLQWLLTYIDKKIDEGKSWTVNNEMLKLGKTLFKEDIISLFPQLKEQLSDSRKLADYGNSLEKIISEFSLKLETIANKVLSKMEADGLTPGDFYRGIGGYFKKISLGKFEKPGAFYDIISVNPDKFPSGKCTRKEEVKSFGLTTIMPAILEIVSTLEKQLKQYNSAVAINNNLHILGLLNSLNEEMVELRKEKGIFLISDASPFIQRIINDNDTPFIYEKSGNYFNHLLIDEFQDTSNMQWGNFKPLISNSLSKNHQCLLVGDVKQSIYRWRNSNWEILESKVKKDFHPEVLKEISLTTNWRSDAQIIRFNNSFFENASKSISSLFARKEITSSTPEKLYHDVKQEIPAGKQQNNGYVSIKTFEKRIQKEEPEYFGSELVENINQLLENNFKPGDIALLVREKKEGMLLADFIINANKKKQFTSSVGIISNESLFLHKSPAVCLLIAAMQFILDPNNQQISAELVAHFLQMKKDINSPEILFPENDWQPNRLDDYLHKGFTEKCLELKQESLYVLTEKLTAILGIYDIPGEIVFIHSFLDLVYEFSNNDIADIKRFLDFWEDKGDSKTISAAETSNCVRILTIHKSKGLQYPAVIIPFADWKMTPKANEVLWLGSGNKPFNQLLATPVNHNKILEESFFEADYIKENYLTLIDNLNLLYVAFTRAENALMVYTIDKGSKSLDTHSLIVGTLNELYNASNSNLPVVFEEKKGKYRIGNIPARKQTQSNSTEQTVPGITPNLSLPGVRFLSQAELYLSSGLLTDNPAAYGKMLHAIMENVIIKNDLESAIRSKKEEGKLTLKEADQIEHQLTTALNDLRVKKWFSGEFTILNEADILLPNGHIKRPDRVMLDADKAIVVDYKFGHEEDNLQHQKQVKSYMDLIKQMGIDHVEGYLWYVLENDIILIN